MPANGLLPGIRRGTWRNFEPPIVCAGNGTVVQPAFTVSANNRCRYLTIPPGLVIAQYQVSLGLGTPPGTGDAYVLELPFPARRMSPLMESLPQIIGQCMPYKTVSATPPETYAPVTLADPWDSLGGAEDRYIQFYIPNIIGSGTGVWPAAVNTTTVTHNLGIAPSPYDIEFHLTTGNLQAAIDAMWWCFDNITTTTFDVSTVRLGSALHGTLTNNYSWKIRTEPRAGVVGSWLVGPNRPWISSFDSFFLEVMYESTVGV